MTESMPTNRGEHAEAAADDALSMSLPEILPMMHRPNTASRKNSAELNLSAILASCGYEPQAQHGHRPSDVAESVDARARPASPFWASL